ncbi:hypothetical protein MXF29_00280 [Pseudomonas sp. NC26]|uniref:hypothetical protein n=1 Tax=Pseudomonas sp. NC26 TaxID=3114535 RepID=UPI002DEF5650|nr:hypothetical protein [Pseudomonas sp. NC26]
MTEEKKPKSNADRQREFRDRQRELGFRQQTMWVHTETEQEGRQAALDGKPLKPQGTKDPVSWAIGWLNEKGKQ